MKATQKVIENGRVTIPKQIREAINIDQGDLVELEIRPAEGDE